MGNTTEKRRSHIITDEGEARIEYKKLVAMRFEVRGRGKTLDEVAFTEALVDGTQVSVRRAGWAGETIHQEDWEYMRDILEYAKSNPAEVYAMLVAADYEPYLQGRVLSEAEFVEMAKNQGTIDLVRERLNTKDERLVDRYYGTKIGSSNTPMLSFPIAPKGSELLN